MTPELAHTLRDGSRRARSDAAAFVEAVGRVEGDRPVPMASVHRKIHALLDRHPRVVWWASVGSGKTQQVSRWRVEYELARDPSLRIGLVSASESHPKKVLKAIASDIERNPHLHRVAPHLRREPGGTWNEFAITVARPDVMVDPSVQVVAPGGSVLGSRLDLIIIDDLVDFQNSLTQYQRDQIHRWVTSELLSRGSTRLRVWAIGNVWSADDALHRLAKLPGWVSRRDPALDEQGRPNFGELMTAQHVHRRAAELGPVYAGPMLFCRLAAAGVGAIRPEWIEHALQRGAEFARANHPKFTGPTFAGVDVGGGDRRDADRSAVATIGIHLDGMRRLLDLRAGRWSGPELVANIRGAHREHGAIVRVESNATQGLLADFAPDVPISKRATTASNKYDQRFGVHSLAIELSQGRWIFPADEHGQPATPEIAALCRALLEYTGDPSQHVADEVMALWIAREAAREQGYAEGDLEPLTFEQLDDMIAGPWGADMRRFESY